MTIPTVHFPAYLARTLAVVFGACVLIACERTATEGSTSEAESGAGVAVATASAAMADTGVVLTATGKEAAKTSGASGTSQQAGADAEEPARRAPREGNAVREPVPSGGNTDTGTQTGTQRTEGTGAGETTSGSSAAGAHGASTAGVAVEDTLLETRVKAALLANPDVTDSNIDVAVTQGRVMLEGSVESEQQLQQALQVVKGVDGVSDVQSNLRVGN